MHSPQDEQKQAAVKSANGKAGSRAISGLLDQAMSSASNGLIVLAVARVASVDAFGAATLLFTFVAAAMGVGRGALGTPIMLAADRGKGGLRGEAEFALTTALLFGLAASALVTISSFLLGVPQMGAAFALAVPLVVIVDVFRYTLISAARPHVALMWDGVWAAGSALLFALTLIRPQAITEAATVLLWSSLAAISASGMALSFRLRPRFRGIGTWWRATRGARIRYGLEAGLGQINIIIITSISTAVVGVSAAASLRGASTLLSPLGVLLSALPLVVIPEAVRRGTPPITVWRKLLRIGLAGSLVVAAIGPALSLLPNHLGESLLGKSWDYARDVLPIISLEHAALFWLATAMSVLRFQGKSASLLTTIIGYTLISTVLCAAMAFLTHAATGVAWGLAASAIVVAITTVIYSRPQSP